MKHFFLFNRKTKEVYAEICPYDGKPDLVYFDSRTIAEKYKPSKAWSVISLKNARYNRLESKYGGVRDQFNGAPYTPYFFQHWMANPNNCKKWVNHNA